MTIFTLLCLGEYGKLSSVSRVFFSLTLESWGLICIFSLIIAYDSFIPAFSPFDLHSWSSISVVSFLIISCGSFLLHPLHGFNFFFSINYVSLLFYSDSQSIISSRFSGRAALFYKFDIFSLCSFLDLWVLWRNRICSLDSPWLFAPLCPDPESFLSQSLPLRTRCARTSHFYSFMLNACRNLIFK